ncbi:MAG: hypothetical protein JSW00_14470 [Thermoplasmata archaeon]|nr:MAG: hypothetical protein JSW00_14470 [Thermoplasmata archaeon]
MKIPVFVSCPTTLNDNQESARKIIIHELDELGLEPRALGRTDYPADFPLKEVLVIANHCSGGVVLGFEQFSTDKGIWKRGMKEERVQNDLIAFSTPWNHLEAGIMFALSLPLIVFKENSISGGVFDRGVTDVFIHKMPMGELSKQSKNALREVFLNWQRKVRAHYYGD